MASLASLLRAAPVVGNGGAQAGTAVAQTGSLGGAPPTLLNALIGTLAPQGSGSVPATSGSSSGGSVGGASPNELISAMANMNSQIGSQYYQQLLSNDPQLAAALQAIASQQSAYQGEAQTAEQQLLEQYGQIPASALGQYANLLNPTVEDLANQNTAAGTSTYAQLQKAYQNANSASLDSLAARGLLRSGATGQDENLNLQNYNNAQASALQTLLGNLGTQQSNLLQQEGTLNQQSETATNDAYQRILAQIQAGTLVAPSIGSGASTPTVPPPAAPSKPPASAAAAPAVPYSPKPPTSPVVSTPAGYVLAPGVAGRAGVGVGGAG